MVTSCLVGPCLSGAPHEPSVSPSAPKGSGLCQGWRCQQPDLPTLTLMCPRQHQTSLASSKIGVWSVHAASVLNKASSKSTFLPLAQQRCSSLSFTHSVKAADCFILWLCLYLDWLSCNLIGSSVLLASFGCGSSRWLIWTWLPVVLILSEEFSPSAQMFEVSCRSML